jgi:DNA uptake protein ComE-like DNA-binding protein
VKQFLKDYFSFNRSERNGLFVMLSIITLLILTWSFLPMFKPREVYDFSAFLNEVRMLERARALSKESNRDHQERRRDFDYTFPDRSAEVAKLAPFPFDPNLMQQADWARLGLTSRQIKSIRKYQDKGGKFRSKQDFKKMYCISDAEYALLESYILLPERFEYKEIHQPQINSEEKEAMLIELNGASPDDLKRIKGIGDYFANKIIAYRTRLGGYIRKEQLLEVSKMDSARYAQMAPFVEVNPNAVRRINVNEADFETLSRHPYIGNNIALSLTNYRQIHGPFVELKDIKRSALITETVYQRIAPYLKVQ